MKTSILPALSCSRYSLSGSLSGFAHRTAVAGGVLAALLAAVPASAHDGDLKLRHKLTDHSLGVVSVALNNDVTRKIP